MKRQPLRVLKLSLTLAFFELQSFTYLIANRISARLPSVPLMSDADAVVPFAPRSLWLYLSFVPYCLIVPYDFGGLRRGVRMCSCIFLNSLVAYRSFLKHPSSFPRPKIELDDTPKLQRGFEALHKVDRPSNTFPSLHVSHTFLFALMLSQHVPATRRDAYLFWASAISLSTLLTKQHYLVDISGGLSAAETVYEKVYRPWTEGQLSLRGAYRDLVELCERLDEQAENPAQCRLEVTQRHATIRQWALGCRNVGGFANLYLQTPGRFELFGHATRLHGALVSLRSSIEVANAVMPGWLQFIRDFEAFLSRYNLREATPNASTGLDDAIHNYLRTINDDLLTVLPLVINLDDEAPA